MSSKRIECETMEGEEEGGGGEVSRETREARETAATRRG